MKQVHHAHKSANHKKAYTLIASIFVIAIALVAGLHTTAPHKDELRFQEHSQANALGSVVPASCYSGGVLQNGGPADGAGNCYCANQGVDWPVCTPPSVDLFFSDVIKNTTSFFSDLTTTVANKLFAQEVR
jgi:hypothetical protein